MPDLGALPSEVRHSRRTSALDFVGVQSLYKSLAPAVYARQTPYNAVRFAVSHCCAGVTLILCALQVLANVLAKLHPREAIQLQRVSR